MPTSKNNQVTNDNLVVFYADDDSDDLDTFKDALNEISSDAIVHLHNRGDKLLTALNNPPPSPNYVFLDLNMPGKNGFEILEEIKQNDRLKHTPVIIVSTSSDVETIYKTRRLGADYYITKPNSYAALKKSLVHVLHINWNERSPDANFVYQNNN